jgi:hypothetical protein
MTLAERGVAVPTVSLARLLRGEQTSITGRSEISLRHLPEVDAEALLRAQPAGPPVPRDGTLLGALFESLVTLCVRVYAQAAEARIGHLRTWTGDREVDLIIERGAQLLAIQVKLSQVVNDQDVRHLLWLRNALGKNLTDAVIITTGPAAYRRPDGRSPPPWREEARRSPHELQPTAQTTPPRPRRMGRLVPRPPRRHERGRITPVPTSHRHLTVARSLRRTPC